MKLNFLTFQIKILIASFAFLALIVSAQSESQFKVSQIITVENPPEAPQNLSAIAVSTSGINLTWDAAVEGDLPVNGYKIFRDDVEIDTTSGTSYSDTGLSPNTLYTYKVSAFDTSGADSPLSDPASATTFPLDEEEEEEQTRGQTGQYVFLKVLNFSVEPDLYQAVINLETNIPSKTILFWGKTPDYEIGSLASSVFKTNHQIIVSDLDPGVLYFFRLEIVDALGRKIILDNQQFKTVSFPEFPFNVSNLRALADEEKIILTWKNPSVDFENIRIIRSPKFFPKDPFDGNLVYEGRGERFVDSKVEKRTDYFYSVFVRDKSGRYSSGALVRGKLLIPGEIPPEPFAGVIDLPRSSVDSMFLGLTLGDFKFIQGDEIAKLERGNIVVVNGDRALKVSLPYEKVPEVLKTLTVTLTHPVDPSLVFSFLLRVNENRSAYEASIAPLGEEGTFGLHVAVLDHKNRGLRKINGILKSILPFQPITFPNFPWLPIAFWLSLLFILLFVAWKFRPRIFKINYENIA